MIPLRDTVRPSRAPVITWALIAVNVLVFFYELDLPPIAQHELILLHGLVPARFTDPAWAAEVGFPPGGYLAFVSSTFLHGGWLHLIGNLWTLHIFGDNVEDAMGRFRFLVFYLLCGIIAGAVQVASDPASATPIVGASGAIAGVLGAYFLLYPHARVLTLVPVIIIPFFFRIPAFVFLAVWFGVQIWNGTSAGMGGTVESVAWWAHVAGFVAGLAGPFLFVRRVPRDDIFG